MFYNLLLITIRLRIMSTAAASNMWVIEGV